MLCQQFAIKFVREARGEVLPHYERDEERVARRPLARGVVQQMKLEWKFVAMTVDERIDTARISLELAPLIRRKRRCGTVGCGAQLQITLHLVVQDEAGAEDFGELTGSVAA